MLVGLFDSAFPHSPFHKKKEEGLSCIRYCGYTTVPHTFCTPHTHMASSAVKRKNSNRKDSSQPAKKNKQHHSHKRDTPTPSATSSGKGGLSALQQKFQKQLEGARFRSINETLYTSTGEHAFTEFSNDPSLFEAVRALYSIYCVLVLMMFSIMKDIDSKSRVGRRILWTLSYPLLRPIARVRRL